jgi:diadenosine tetraphosphate (Ap4A) HIT family hydrolase
MSCPFCGILESKSNILYETDRVIVLADRFPLSTNHILIIPRAHKPFLHLYSEDELSDIFSVIKLLVKKLNLEKYNILQNNGHIQSVPHLHFHLVPFNARDDCLIVDWKARRPSEGEYAEAVKRLRDVLEGK